MATGKLRLSPEDREFFGKLGARIAAFRKERGWTQVQLAAVLGCSQPHYAQFEKGLRRIPVSELTILANAFGLSLDELVGAKAKPGKRGPAPLLQRQVERIAKLPRSKQRFVTEMIELALQRAQG